MASKAGLLLRSLRAQQVVKARQVRSIHSGLSTLTSDTSSFTGRSSSCGVLHRRQSQWRHNTRLNIASSHRVFSDSTNSSSDDDAASATKKEEKKGESREFQAETKQLLDIVTHSLYTDKEVFLRELISNASDALEKLRHMQTANQGGSGAENAGDLKAHDPELPLEIRIETDEVNGTITIADTGIGMTKQDMIDHLGTIAKSGSKAFINEIAQKSGEDGGAFDASKGIIGKFGVGFYSSFMVGDKVEVRSM